MTYNRTITKAAEIISIALVGAGIAADGWTMQIISVAPIAADADRYTVAVYQPRHRIPSTVWALTIDTAHDGWTIAARTMECTYNRDTAGAELAPRHALASAMTGRIRVTAPDVEPEAVETVERAAEPHYLPAAAAQEDKTPGLNPMCRDCTRHGTDCDGTTCMAWTGCVNRKTAYRSAAELAAARRARGWAVCKRDLLALAGGGCKPLRWVCIRYKLSFYGLDPYCMGAELMAGGVRIVYDDTAISPADNRAEQRRVQRAYMAREGARA